MGVALAASAVVLASPAPAPAGARAQGGSQTFAYTGSPQRFTVPDGVCALSVTAYGAAGGAGQYGNAGGKGARVTASLGVRPGQVLTVDVGGAGHDGGDATAPTEGGYGGGGQGGAYRVGGQIHGIASGGGGGRTVIGSGSTPLVTAGGGGGGGGSHFPGDLSGGAGGESGEPGNGLPGDSEGKPGRPGGEGGKGGTNVPVEDPPNGTNGGAAQGPAGGRGGDSIGDPHGGAGGGGGGGATGGGGGAASPTAYNSGAGGGGGSSSGPSGATFGTGEREGDGEAVLRWEPCATGSLTVEKTDKADGKPLAGGVFQAWRETNGTPGLQTGGGDPDTATGPACATDQRGTCTFGDLPLDSYYLRETDVPEGYRLPADPVSGPYTLTAAKPDATAAISNGRAEPCKGKDCK